MHEGRALFVEGKLVAIRSRVVFLSFCALDCSVWGDRFGRGFEPVVRQLLDDDDTQLTFLCAKCWICSLRMDVDGLNM